MREKRTDSAHGGDIYTFAKRLGIKPLEVIDFSSNINRYRPKIRKDFNTIEVSAYAEPTNRKLKKRLARKYGVDSTQIALFNGASSAIATLVSQAQEVVIYAPAYSEYNRFAKKVTLINRFDNLYAIPPKGALVVFVNPATPDGRYYDLERLFSIWKMQQNSVLIDESFLEFTPFASASEYLDRFDDLMIVKSLTKFYACAGVRVGAVISHEEKIAAIEAAQPAWQLSTYDMTYILEALKDREFPERARKRVARDKARFYAILSKASCVAKIYPSDANFVLVQLAGIDAVELQVACAAENILIRNCENFDFLDNRHVRFAVRGKEDTKRLKKVLFA